MRQRGSSSKLQVLNTALMMAQVGRTFTEARQDGNRRGRLVESCVGAHLLNSSMGSDLEVTYWRDGNQEVDFVLRQGAHLVALEVKSGRGKNSLPGMEAFAWQFKPQRQLLVGGQGIPLEEFLSKGEIALGVSSRASLVWPKREVNSMRVVLCGVGVVDLSINPYAHSLVRKATLFAASEIGLNGYGCEG